MRFEYDPRDALPCLPPGQYDADLRAVSVTRTPRGLPSVWLEFAIIGQEPSRRIVGWIVNPTTLYLLAEFAGALRARDQFNNGTFDVLNCKGRRVRLDVRVITSMVYGEQNVIAHYLPIDDPDVFRTTEEPSGTPKEPGSEPSSPQSLKDDFEIPF